MGEDDSGITLWFLFELIGAILVAYIAVDVSVAYAKGTIHEKLNLARDISVQIDAMLGVSGDTYLIKDNFNGYSLKITGNKIEVFEAQNEISKGIAYFVKSENININVFLQNPKQVVVSKINGQIKVSEQIPSIK